MITETINNDTTECDFAITFIMKNVPEQDATATRSAIKGNPEPIYFYLLGRRLAYIINDLANDNDVIDRDTLLTFLKQGIDDEINNQEGWSCSK